MYKKIFLILIVVLLISTPIYAETLNWQPVNYSSPDLIKESGLTVEEFNDLTQAEWVDLFNDKEKVNFAFSATDSEGNDITSTVNPNLSILVSGLSDSQTIEFEKIAVEETEEELIPVDPKVQVNINNNILEYDRVVYVDSVNGNDSTGTGDFENPLKTILKASTLTDVTDAIYLKEGLYNEVNTEPLIKGDLIGGSPGKVIVNTGTYRSWGRGIRFTHNTHNVYNVIFRHDNGANSDQSYVLGNNNTNGTGQTVNFHNCVFENKNTTYKDYYFVKIKVNFYNSFDNVGMSVYTGTLSKATNSILTTDSFDLNYTNLLKSNISFDEKYSITSSGWKNTGTGKNPDGSKANIGVYGGQYSW